MYINDRSIDLTENEDFRQLYVGSLSKLLKTDSMKIIGSQSFPYLNKKTSKKALYFTGSAEEIRTDIQYGKYVFGQYCERCGTMLMPWEQCLCFKCDEELMIDVYGVIPWEKERIHEDINNMFV